MLADNGIAPPFSCSPSSTGTGERLSRRSSVLYPPPSYVVFIISLSGPAGLCWSVCAEDLHTLVRCLAAPNQYVINSPEVIVEALIASRSCFTWDLASTLLAGNFKGFRSGFRRIVARRIRHSVICVLACQGLMSLHFPTLSWCDALSVIGMWGERISQKKAEEQSVCQISLSSPKQLMYLIW